MRKIGFALTAALAASIAFGATAASAQSWAYDQYQADRAYQNAHIREHQAHQDQRAANEAAWYGDYGAADHFARAAQHNRDRAWGDARYAGHAEDAARWNYWHRGWGY